MTSPNYIFYGYFLTNVLQKNLIFTNICDFYDFGLLVLEVSERSI